MLKKYALTPSRPISFLIHATELPASNPAHEEGADRPALGPGAQGPRHRPGLREGFPDLRAPDRPRAAVARRSEPRIHLLHEEKVKPAAAIAVFVGVVPLDSI